MGGQGGQGGVGPTGDEEVGDVRGDATVEDQPTVSTQVKVFLGVYLDKIYC